MREILEKAIRKNLSIVDKIKKCLQEKMADIEKHYDVADWTTFLEPSRMEGEEAHNRGYYEAMKVIKDIMRGTDA